VVAPPLHPSSSDDHWIETRFEYLETQKSPEKLETPYINDKEALSPQATSS
jgi:hypothetical protein